MAGTSSKTKVVTIRLPVALAAEWTARAETRGETIAAYIIREMTAPLMPRSGVATSPTTKQTVSPARAQAAVSMASVPYVGTEPPKQPTWWQRDQDRKAKAKVGSA